MRINYKIFFYLILGALLHLSFISFSQNFNTHIIEKQRLIRAMFYNCENFFDTQNDSIKNDEEFLPEGDKHWTTSKYFEKQNQVSKVITAIGGWSPPDIVGLCEIENSFVLNGLIRNSPLYNFEYKIAHKESPDQRGIDVAMLYQPKKFKLINTDFIKIKFEGSTSTTRDILYASGIIPNNDTLHVFITHWPSRWGGQLESEYKRVHVANIMKQTVDSIFNLFPTANILIMGDFNDEPFNKSVQKVLKAKQDFKNIEKKQLYNLSSVFCDNPNIGTHKYKGKWSVLDQIIVSGNLLLKNTKTCTSEEDIHIYNADFLLEKDNNHLGVKPYRTYIGFKYHGGFSDHLPTFIDFHNN